MTIADELRQYADKAIKEGGMYFSGNYLDGLAKRAESEQAENAKLRELVQKMMRFMEDGDWCTTCEVAKECDAQECEEQEQYEEDCLMRGVFHDRMRELGVEV